MSTNSDQITTIRAQALAQLEQLTVSPKPSYSIDGQKISWAEYMESLQQTVDWCDQQLVDCQPFECQSEGTTG